MAAQAPYPSQRFLYLYHYLELDYDYEIVKEIKRINEDNPKELWAVLKMSRDDIERINHLLLGYSNIETFEQLFNKIRYHEPVASRIFYEYGKESNPLKEKSAFDAYFVDSPEISREELKKIKQQKNFKDNFPCTLSNYNEKIIKLSCYWTYRVRCCITHNKLGEYHMESDEDNKFLIEFAEPLLTEMIKYRMTK